MSKPSLDAFLGDFQVHTYPARTLILRAGDTPEVIYYLRQGFVKQYSISETGQELTLQIYKPDSYFYLSWLRSTKENYYYFETMSKVKLSKIPLVYLKDVLDANMHLYVEMQQRVFRGIDQLLFRMETLAFGTALTKVCATLLLLGMRFGRVTPQGIIIDLPVTHREIALMSALTRETVSVEMSKLKKQGAIDQNRGHLVILNKALLRSHVPYQVER